MSDDYPEVNLDGDPSVLRVQKFGLRVPMSEEMIRGPKDRGWWGFAIPPMRRFGFWFYTLQRTADERFEDEVRNDTWVLVVEGSAFTKWGAMRKMRKARREFQRVH